MPRRSVQPHRLAATGSCPFDHSAYGQARQSPGPACPNFRGEGGSSALVSSLFWCELCPRARHCAAFRQSTKHFTNRLLILFRHSRGWASHPAQGEAETQGLTASRALPGESQPSRLHLTSWHRTGAALGLPGGKGPRPWIPGSLASDRCPQRDSVDTQGWVVTKSLATELLRLSLAILVQEAREVTCASCYRASI